MPLDIVILFLAILDVFAISVGLNKMCLLKILHDSCLKRFIWMGANTAQDYTKYFFYRKMKKALEANGREECLGPCRFEKFVYFAKFKRFCVKMLGVIIKSMSLL